MKNFIATLLALTFLVSGCTPKEESEPVNLTIVHGWGGTSKVHAIMQEIYDDFDKQNEDIVLISQPSSDSSIAVEKANDMLALNDMASIVSTNGQSDYVDNALKREKLLNLMPYIEADTELMGMIHPSVLEKWTNKDGSLYTLPDALEVMGYWYNERYFKEAGIVDKNGEVALPKTWEEFYQVCAKLEGWNTHSHVLKAVYALEDVQTVENLLFARLAGESTDGLQMVSEMPRTYDVKVFRDVVEDFQNIYKYSYNTDSIENARQFFVEGSTAMYFNGVWESEAIQSSLISSEVAYANYPTNYGKMLSYVSPSSGYVIYNSKNDMENERAIRFLKYILSEDIQIKLATETGQAPSNPNVDNGIVAEKYPVLGNALKVAHNAEIQLKTITSVWSKASIEVLIENLEKSSKDVAVMEQMISKLNTIENIER